MLKIFDKIPFNKDDIYEKLEPLKPFKIPIILLLVVLLLLGGSKLIPPLFNKLTANRTPIKKITATCDKKCKAGSKVDVSDFKITAIHKNGGKSSVSSDEVEAVTEKISPIGSKSKVTLRLKENKDITCDTEVKISREKVVTFEIGYPNPSAVKATLYDSGEFAFTGNGNIMTFEEGDMPWFNSDNIDLEETPIKSITFGKGVKPTSLNYFFEGLETLTYIGSIPDTVQSMYKTFADCIKVKNTGDWTACGILLDITSCYSGCYSLTHIHPIPGNVRTANSCFEGCSELLETADMSQAVSLTDCVSMFADCKKIASADIGPVVENAESMYSGCFNLKSTPEFPKTLINMDSMFSGDESLSSCAAIPKSVKHLANAFYGCRSLSGEITINCNNTDYDTMFSEACIATQVNLVGKSIMLDAFANTCDSENVFVNGYSADKNINSYEEAYEKMKAIKKKTKKKKKK